MSKKFNFVRITFVFSSSICINDVAKSLRPLDTIKMLLKSFKKASLKSILSLTMNFVMGKTYSVLGIIYCYLMKYRLSLGHFSISIQQNCFINTLKNIHPITLHGCLIVVIVMTKVAVANRDSLIPNGDESNVLDDDQNVSQTFDIPLKIKSLFQLIYCNILKGKKNTIAHNELKCNL